MFDYFSNMDNSLLQRYVIEGGPVMFILVPLSLIMLGAVLQGAIRLRRSRVLPARLIKNAKRLSRAERADFIRGLADDPSPLAQVVWVALRDHAHDPEPPNMEELAPVITAATADSADEMYDSVSFLEAIYTIGPLLGLLGTILGMKQTFYGFSREAEQTISSLSVGIQQALVTTFWGIAVAIPAYTAAHILQARIRRHERVELPRAATLLIGAIYASEPAVEAEPVAEAVR